MAGPWRVRFVHHDDPCWRRLVDAGLILADAGGAYSLHKAALLNPAAAMEAVGGFMPWPFFNGGHDAPGDPPLGTHTVCPQCGGLGSVGLRRDPRYPGATWDWNGSADAPTLRPSILSAANKGGCGGHYWLTDGILTDCGGHR